MPPIDNIHHLTPRENLLLPRATGFDNLSQNIFGLTALVVSLVALGTTTIQVFHQYFASAEGYRRCHKSVMGLWAAGTKRKLRWFQFRMEVLFETPVMFTAPPDNKNGPIKGRPIHYANGTEESYNTTMVEMPEAQEQALTATTMKVHTADDERATWVTLLSTLQNAEKFSRAWDASQRQACNSDILAPSYGLEVALQKKTRSWDFLPPSVTKPYASSTICHLVEFMAMLGLHWKVFDQQDWNLRAEGNGFILTSTAVLGLGVMVVFEKTGQSHFEDRRVIPCMAIKDLSFGVVSTIFNDKNYLANHRDAQSLDLVFDSKVNVAETLESLGCSFGTIEQYGKDHKHIFSVSFEIIGMLGQVFRNRNSCFRVLPNPTGDPWLKNAKSKTSWEMIRCVEFFAEHVEQLQAPQFHRAVADIKVECRKLVGLKITTDAELTLAMRETVNDILDRQTKFLSSVAQARVLKVVAAHIAEVTTLLSDTSSPLNSSVFPNKEETLIQAYFKNVRPKVSGFAEADSTTSGPALDDAAELDAIWISLIFRMLCWLLLHDFDKSDIMIVPSELRGSRMPIYIG